MTEKLGRSYICDARLRRDNAKRYIERELELNGKLKFTLKKIEAFLEKKGKMLISIIDRLDEALEVTERIRLTQKNL